MPRPDVVWLASYPKSGNTWLRMLLANLRSGLDSPAGINSELVCMPEYRSRNGFDNMTLLESGMLTGGEIECLQPLVYAGLAAELHETAYCKIHDAYLRNSNGVPIHGACRAVVYVIRDPRDVAVSLAHHLGIGVNAAIATMNSPSAALALNVGRQRMQMRQRLLDWSGHVRSWTEQTDVPVHVIRYEDMKRDTEGVFGGVLEFVDQAATADDILRAVRFSSLAELQRQERSEGFRERLAHATSPFFRQGEAGGWRRVLTDAQADEITAAHRDTMARFGYSARLTPEDAFAATAKSAADSRARTTGRAVGAR